MKFLCLAYEEERVLTQLTQDEWRALRKETLDFVDDLRQKGILLDARPLQSATNASTVRIREGAVQVTDGPFAETKEQLAGFYLIESRDLNEAIQLAAKIPAARVGSVEVRPVRQLDI